MYQFHLQIDSAEQRLRPLTGYTVQTAHYCVRFNPNIRLATDRLRYVFDRQDSQKGINLHFRSEDPNLDTKTADQC